QEYRCNLVQGETNEVEPYPSNGSPAAEVGVGQLFKEARDEQVDSDEENCEADVHHPDERSQSGTPLPLQVLDLLHVLGNGFHTLLDISSGLVGLGDEHRASPGESCTGRVRKVLKRP